MQSARLADGRSLAYAVFGKQTLQQTPSVAIIYHHGWPSSCMEGQAWHDAAQQLDLRIIAVDRPGCGGSTYNPQGTFSSYASDIKQLMQHLKLPTVIHMGTSGGGPYACACAALNPAKTTAGLSLVASMTHCTGPGSSQLLKGMDWSNRLGYNMIAYAPGLTALGLAATAPIMSAAPAVAQLLLRAFGVGADGSLRSSNSSSSSSGGGGSDSCIGSTGEIANKSGTNDAPQEKPARRQQQQQLQQQQGTFPVELIIIAGRALLYASGVLLPAADRQVLLDRPGLVLHMLPQLLADSVAQGSRGLYADMRLTTLPWEFDLGRIQAPTQVFQGDADVNVTVAMAKHLAKQVPGAELHMFPGATHFSLVAEHARDILAAVKSSMMCHT